MLSLKQLFAIFLVAFAVLLFALMPARAMAGWVGLDQYIRYERIEGGLSHVRLEGVEVGGFPLGTVTIEPELDALLLGNLQGSVALSDMGRSGRADVTALSDTQILLEDASLITPLALTAKGWPLSGDVALTAQSLTLDAGQGCVEGTFDMRTDMFSATVSALGGGDLILAGTGQCADGQVSANLTGENAAVALDVTFELSRQGQVVADVTLTPKSESDSQEALQTMLNFAGLQRQKGGKWVGRIEAPLSF